MFVFNNVPSFKEFWRKGTYGFRQRVDNSLNQVVNAVANTSLLSSQLRKHWRTVLYILLYWWHSPDEHVGVNVLLYNTCHVFLWATHMPEIKGCWTICHKSHLF